MKEILVKSYHMSKISTYISKRYGEIKIGDEDEFLFELLVLETNLLKLYKKDSNNNSRRALEAVRIAMLTIDGYLRDVKYDFSRVENEGNLALFKGLAAAYDPYINEDIYPLVIDSYNLNDPQEKEKYFTIPAKCLVRLEKSINLWIEKLGVNGYFTFIQRRVPMRRDEDETMHFIVRMNQ